MLYLDYFGWWFNNYARNPLHWTELPHPWYFALYPLGFGYASWLYPSSPVHPFSLIHYLNFASTGMNKATIACTLLLPSLVFSLSIHNYFVAESYSGCCTWAITTRGGGIHRDSDLTRRLRDHGESISAPCDILRRGDGIGWKCDLGWTL